jgi:hypothetical protein
MKTVSIFGILLLYLLLGCDKVKEDMNRQYTVEIVGFDLNCSTCIVSFPDDFLEIKKLFGESHYNYYEIVNLFKGDFEIGDRLRVNVRKVETAELNTCITFYPSSDYNNLYVSNYAQYNNVRLNDTVDLAYKDCLNDSDGKRYICFDTVLTDSRCPTGAVCVWAGEAIVRFKIEKYNSFPVFIDLKEGVKDTLVCGYQISFIKLLPYPTYGNPTKPEDYKAGIIIKSN